jgi:hypothetical protein
MASSPEIVAYCRRLEFRWLRLAEQAHETGGALGHESCLTATLFPLHDKPAAYPAEYAKRAGELIARSARYVAPTKANELMDREGHRSSPPAVGAAIGEAIASILAEKILEMRLYRSTDSKR